MRGALLFVAGALLLPQLAVAQVHATLALAAATALGRLGEGGRPYEDDRVAWVAVASEVPAASARRRAAERAEAAELREKEG